MLEHNTLAEAQWVGDLGSIAPIVIDVVEGDLIYLGFASGGTINMEILETTICVQVIE